MPRRRLKHKQIIETLEQDDIAVAKQKLKDFYTDKIQPVGGTIWTSLIVFLVAVVIFFMWKNSRAAQFADANQFLAQAKSDYESGDVNSALSALNKVQAGGQYAQPGISTAAEMVSANIAFASGEYGTAISALTKLIPAAPELIRPDLLYQLATAQESKGDFAGALESLEQVTKYLGAEPDTKDINRKGSVWDRYYFQKGRVLLRMKQDDEGIKLLLKVSQKSPWSDDAGREIAWHESHAAEALPLNWTSPKS